MDHSNTSLDERSHPTTNLNGSVRRVSTPQSPGSNRQPSSSVSDSLYHIVQLVVHKDERGYGMKVSGDNPVYVQSVKEGGAAEKAGLHAGDKILKVNGRNVMSSTHTEVVTLIRSSPQVTLAVQQRSSARSIGSPVSHARSSISHASTTITSPLPVDNEKQHQLLVEKEQHYRLMIEKQQRYIDTLRSQLASSPDEKMYTELVKTERNLHTLQAMLQRSQVEQPFDNNSYSSISPNGGGGSPNGNSTDTPPPLPKRTYRGSLATNKLYSNTSPAGLTDLFLKNEINANQENDLVESPDTPPPLPPRNYPFNGADAVNSLNKQMSYPLVATCATLVDNHSPTTIHSHQRTKSSPDSLLNVNMSNNSPKMNSSESMNDLTHQDTWDGSYAPPGTPPPPYPSPRSERKTNNGEDSQEVNLDRSSSIDASPMRGGRTPDGSLIHAATPQSVQQPILSMEDDETSDIEIEESIETSPFKSLARLWESPVHMAVFTNFVLSNADPNSLLFYLLTDLYKEGNAKEMRKWAFEIHSCFLVPGALLRLKNVDENIAREIDDVLTREFDKEEILRKVFWKARSRAKEELAQQLVDFQVKRTAGLGSIFCQMSDADLLNVIREKTELKFYESLLLNKLDPYIDELDKNNYDPAKFYTAAAISTVLNRVFGLHLPTAERCPSFVSKEKPFRSKFLVNRFRKVNFQGHQFVGQQYFSVISCSHCHQIIYGLAPQGYQCSVCLINVHRRCVRLYEDSCPGPINKKDRGFSKFMRMKPHDSSDHRRKASSYFINMERDRRQAEEKDNLEVGETGESKPGQPVSRSGSDRRPDSVREENFSKYNDSLGGSPGNESGPDRNEDVPNSSGSSINLPTSGNKRRTSNNVFRSESFKEQSEKQRKQRRNYSDPSQNTTSLHSEVEQSGLSNTPDSGSSSTSSISFNGRLSESPSNANELGRSNRSDADSDMDCDADHKNWQDLVSPEQLNSMPPQERKRLDVMNELFHTEKSHVRNLTVLYKIFFKSIQKSQALKPEELFLVFPNIKELLDLHKQFNNEMVRKRKEDPLVRELGATILNLFGGPIGEAFKEAAAKFCERQQLALELIKERRKKDSKFDSILCEGEKHDCCKRLNLQGILPVEMQRLSKYPLLLERLIGAVQACNESEEEVNKLRRAHQLFKDIANYVNEATKLALNRARLEEIQRHLDQSNFERSNDPISQEFRPLDLTKYRLVREGPMQLRRPNKGPVTVHVLLMEEVVVILHKEGDKFLLKFFQSGAPGQTNPLSPIIKISTLLVRVNAVCKNALFLVNTSTNNSHMYDLLAEDVAKRDVWFRHFTDVTESHNRREGKTRHPEPPPENEDDETVQDFPEPPDISAERAAEVSHEESDRSFRSTNGEETDNDNKESEKEEQETDGIPVVAGTGTIPRITAEEWPLIQPSQVHIAVAPIHTAESRLTPLEQIRRKDEEIRRALEDKEGLVADLLSIPRDDFQDIVDMVGEEEASSDPVNLVMASIYQTDRLNKVINESLTVQNEADPVLATGGRYPSCACQTSVRCNHLPSVPLTPVKDVASKLTKHLTELLGKLRHMEEEKNLLRNELCKVRERLHDQLSLHDIPVENSSAVSSSTLENCEEVETETTTEES